MVRSRNSCSWNNIIHFKIVGQGSQWSNQGIVRRDRGGLSPRLWNKLVIPKQRLLSAVVRSFSDIMGATADRLVLGKNESEVWSVGEDMAHGNWYDNDKGIRKMDDPDQFRDPNHISQYFCKSLHYWRRDPCIDCPQVSMRSVPMPLTR